MNRKIQIGNIQFGNDNSEHTNLKIKFGESEIFKFEYSDVIKIVINAVESSKINVKNVQIHIFIIAKEKKELAPKIV